MGEANRDVSDEKNGESQSVLAGVSLQFNYAAGEAASRFLIALRDEKRIYGARCPMCRRVLVPARSFCPRCWAELREWIEVGPTGTLIAFAKSTPRPSSPQRNADLDDRGFHAQDEEGIPEMDLGLIRLDGADSALVHFVLSSARRTGMRVTARFAEKRTGSILDIAYFEPTPRANRKATRKSRNRTSRGQHANSI